MPTLTDFILENFEPVVAGVIVVIMTLQAKLNHEDDWVESYKHTFAVWFNPAFSVAGRPLVREKDDSEYIATLSISEDMLEKMLDRKYDRQLLSTKKYIVVDGKKKWSDGSWAYQYKGSDKQHHIYYFVTDDGIRVQGHKEWSTYLPSKHNSGVQEDGDPDGVFFGLVDKYHGEEIIKEKKQKW